MLLIGQVVAGREAGQPRRWAGTRPATPNGGRSLGPTTVASRSLTQQLCSFLETVRHCSKSECI